MGKSHSGWKTWSLFALLGSSFFACSSSGPALGGSAGFTAAELPSSAGAFFRGEAGSQSGGSSGDSSGNGVAGTEQSLAGQAGAAVVGASGTSGSGGVPHSSKGESGASGGGVGGGGVGGGSSTLPTAGATSVDGSASAWHCVNWAVNGDNFQSGPLLLSGIFTTDTTYDAVKARAKLVVDGYADLLKANAYRIPINEPTVNTPSTWASYKAVIDAGTQRRMKVLLGFWAKDTGIGKPADINAWYKMWQTVIDAYVDNPYVFFDIHNEPHGYSNQQWIQQVKDWLAKYPKVPKNRVVIAGTGWDDNVANVASAFPDMPLYEVHDYVFNGNFMDPQRWSSQLLGRLGGGVKKTIVGEFGAAVANGDFKTTSNANSAFVAGFTNAIHDNQMGSCWWPGLWAVPGNSSSWGLLKMNGTGENISYAVANQSALDRIWHSWGLN